MRKLLTLAGTFAVLSLSFAFGLAVSAHAESVDALDHGGRGRGKIVGFAECAACDTPDTPVSLADFVACVTEKVNATDLPDEVKAKIIEKAQNAAVDANGNVICPQRGEPGGRPGHPGRPHVGFRECAACDTPDTPVSLADYVACVTEKVNATDLPDEAKAKIIEKAQNAAVDENGNVICPERPERPGRPGGPGNGRRGGRG